MYCHSTPLRYSLLSTLFLFLAVSLSAKTLTVTTPIDNRPGSLRTVIAAAVDGDVIEFGPETAGVPIVLEDSIVIYRKVTIRGLDTSRTVISGGGASQIFIAQGTRVRIENLTMTDGWSNEEGGAIVLRYGELSLLGCVVRNSRAERRGGAIFVDGRDSLNLRECSLYGNVAAGETINDGGGALFSFGGRVELRSCELSMNRAIGAVASGGAIYISSGGAFYLYLSTVRDNTAGRGGGGFAHFAGPTGYAHCNGTLFENNRTTWNGGGVYIGGKGNIYLTNGTIRNNHAGGGGGGLWNGDGEMTLHGTLVEGNQAEGDDDYQRGGGGVYNNGGLLVLNGALIFDNVATGTNGSGGGIYNAPGGKLTTVEGTSVIRRNRAMRSGGGIEDASGASTTTELRDLFLDSNAAEGITGKGGGLHVSGDGDVTLYNCIVNGNSAASQGGGLFNGTGRMTIEQSGILKNRAEGDRADEGGGGIYNGGGYLLLGVQASTLMNLADGTNGSGGGIFNGPGGMVRLDSASVTDNMASGASGGIEDASGASTTLEFHGAWFSRNRTGTTPGNGGAIHVTGDGRIEMVGGYIEDNRAENEGGGLFNGEGYVSILGTAVFRNRAEGGGGGGLFNETGTLLVERATISENQAIAEAGHGGGLSSRGGQVTLFRSTLSKNTAGGLGGGLAVGGDTRITATTIAENIATEGPGIAVVDNGSVRVGSSLIALNTAAVVPGDLAVVEGSLTSDGYNLIGIDLGSIIAEIGDMTGSVAEPIDPLLGEYEFPYGVYSLRCESPAINMGDPEIEDPDQRDSAVFNGRRDIGAYEVQTECGPASVEERSSFVAMSRIYPMPSIDGRVTIDVPEAFGTSIVILVSEGSSGRVLQVIDATPGILPLDLTPLPSGTYMIEVLGDNVQRGERVVIAR